MLSATCPFCAGRTPQDRVAFVHQRRFQAIQQNLAQTMMQDTTSSRAYAMTLCCRSLRQFTAIITLLCALPACRHKLSSISEPITAAKLLMPYANSGASDA